MNNNKTSISDELIVAYGATNFEVYAEKPFVLKVGEFSHDLETLFSKLKYNHACFITAYNPESVELSICENKLAQAKLYEDLLKLECKILEGCGSDPEGKWEGEPSYFVLGIKQSDAINLGKKFKQNAIVWCNQNCIPELMLLN